MLLAGSIAAKQKVSCIMAGVNRQFHPMPGCEHQKKTAWYPVATLPDGNIIGLSKCIKCGSRYYRKYRDDNMKRRMKMSEDDFTAIGAIVLND